MLGSYNEQQEDKRKVYLNIKDGAGATIWTDSEEEVKRAIRYDLLATKPVIKPITSKD